MGKSEIRRDPEILDDLDCGQFQRFLSRSLLASRLVIQRQCHKSPAPPVSNIINL